MTTVHKTQELKLVLLGDTGVGKSCIVVRFVNNSFNQATSSTMGASFLRKTIVVEQTAYKFQIWDTAGQEKYRALTSMYYRGATAAIIVFDITRSRSFEQVKFWVRELRTKGNEDTLIALVGNKLDRAAARQVDRADAKRYAELIDASYSEVSALTGEGVADVFIDLTRRVPSSNEKEVEDVVNPLDQDDDGGCGC
eukprot:gnl/Dysnectes_brevis/1423_a1611_3146.p1 GENE.gnl/Dysnectes_brevis/1423_a1611_3146~~gnl/Dysnectes_brevis/1423_a1611_3146.p1  ORF type:complete len:212 (-),score=39.21 gnl/Dysnectes_brevis/1423_a1611_3146:113-700(-)